MEKEISLEEWISGERACLNAFRDMWYAEQGKVTAEMFPDALPAGEWDEQFRAFVSENPSHIQPTDDTLDGEFTEGNCE